MACPLDSEFTINRTEQTADAYSVIFVNAHIYEIGRLQFEVNRYEYKIENFDMKDEFCVDVHIPRGGRLDNSLVEKSLTTAQNILPHIYKELSVVDCTIG